MQALVLINLRFYNQYSFKGEHLKKVVIIGGGVASNQLLREEIADKSPVPVFIPRPNLCTDNGAMIARTGWIKFKEKPSPQWDLDVIPGLKIG